MCPGAIAAAVTAIAGASAGTIATIGTVLTGVAGVAGAVSSYQNAKKQEAVARQNAEAARQNALIQQQTALRNAQAQQVAARDVLRQGEDESTLKRRQVAEIKGKQRAQFAAAGIDVNSSEAIGLLDETNLLGEEDAFAIRENARRESDQRVQLAKNYQADAQSIGIMGDARAGEFEAAADTAGSAKLFEPIGTVLGAGSKVASKWAGIKAGAYA